MKTYDKERTKVLIAQFDSIDSAKKSRVDNFLNANSSYQYKFSKNGAVYQMVDVLEGKPIYISTYNANAAKATNTNDLHPGGSLGLNLEGENLVVGMWDEGTALPTHVEFLDDQAVPETRVSRPDNIGPTTSFHATHVGGTLIAKGTNSSAKGMAPKADLLSYNWDSDRSEATSEASNGLLISNHSYGVPIFNGTTQQVPDWYPGTYDSESRNWDQVIFDYPYYLMVCSAGNEGGSSPGGMMSPGIDKLTGEKNAKNNLVIANANPQLHVITGEITSLAINSSSSQGPSDDGRVKPDIAGDGTGLFSSINSGVTDYGTASGTSMASPNVAGSMLLLQEHYFNTFGSFMRASTLKGLVCHSAREDDTRVGPDPYFGWGFLDAGAAAQIITGASNNSTVLSELTLEEDQTYTLTFTVQGSSKVTATICWTDKPGIAQSGNLNDPTPALINDLDIRITKDAETFYPWKLDLANIGTATPASKGDNLVDTVERIDIETPTPGTYTITVSHKGDLQGAGLFPPHNQDFALILSGNDVSLSNQDFEIANFKVWPNPVKDKLNYSFETLTSDDVLMQIFDVNGRTVYSSQFKASFNSLSGDIDMSSYAKGVYFVRVKQGNKVQTLKVIR